MALSKFEISYPDFQLGEIIQPDEFDVNNREIVGRIGELTDVLNQITDSIGGTGGDIISIAPIAPFIPDKLQTFLEHVVERLGSSAPGAGSDFIGAVPVSGVSGNTIKEQMDSLKTLLDTISTMYLDEIARLDGLINTVDGKIIGTNNALANNSSRLTTLEDSFKLVTGSTVNRVDFYDKGQIEGRLGLIENDVSSNKAKLDTKTDKTGNHQGTWQGINLSNLSEVYGVSKVVISTTKPSTPVQNMLWYNPIEKRYQLYLNGEFRVTGDSMKVNKIENRVVTSTATNTAVHGVTHFNSNFDSIMVFQNSVFIKQGVDYTVSPDGKYILKIEGTWDEGTVIDFTILSSIPVMNDFSFTEIEAQYNKNISQENARVLAEASRVQAEQARVLAENERGTILSDEIIKINTNVNNSVNDAIVKLDNQYAPRLTSVEEDLTAHKEEFTQLNGEERLTILEESKIKKYGVKFLGSNPAGERLYDAIGMVANVAVDDEVVVNDFDNVSFFDRPICNVYFDTNGNPQVMAYRGEPGFSFGGGIFPPYAEKSDVYYECSPCAWNGSFDTPVVTGTPIEGFELFDCFPDWNTKIYLPTFFMGMEDGRPTSRSGVKPGYYSINTTFTTAQAWNANAHGETINVHMYEYILQCIEFATRDLQTVMYGVGTLTYNSETDLALISETGVNRIILARANNYVIGQTIVVGTARNGDNVTGERIVTSIESYDENGQALHFDGEPANIGIGNFVSSRAYKNGATDIVIASSGSPVSNTSGKYPCIWRGKVDPWGNGYSGICNLLIKRYGAGTPENPCTYKPWYLKDPKKYANGVITDDYIELSYNMPVADGYTKKLGQDARFPLIGLTKEIGAGSTTYYSDYYYYPRYDIGAVFVGGHFGGGRYGGPLYFLCYDSPAIVGINRLARLFVTPL